MHLSLSPIFYFPLNDCEIGHVAVCARCEDMIHFSVLLCVIGHSGFSSILPGVPGLPVPSPINGGHCILSSISLKILALPKLSPVIVGHCVFSNS